jgi:hypothetical protein
MGFELTTVLVIGTDFIGSYRGFKVFDNRRYFLNFRRYLKN